jgi:molybdate transport system ATP-binding protein
MSGLEVDLRVLLGDFLLNARFGAPADGITALFGPSGSGKSTLLAALAGLKRGEGHVVLNGRPQTDTKRDLHVAAHRRGFGMVFQEARLFPHLNVRENLAYALHRAPVARFVLDDVAQFFDITGLLQRPVGNLSGGEKSRVALARALLAAPEFLLLDEPFAALDGQRRRAFIAVLLKTHRRYKIPMLVVSHSIDDAAALASHLVALKEGKVVAQGPFADVALAPSFQALLDARDIGAVLPVPALLNTREDEAEGLWLRADHVLVGSEPPHGLSARNVIEGRVIAIKPEGPHSALVELRTLFGTVPARLTPEAVSELELKPGKPAWAVIKAHAV